MSYTTDPKDPRLTRGVDEKPVQQADTYRRGQLGFFDVGVSK